MLKFLTRIVALFLVPCLLADPATATALNYPLSLGRGPVALGVRGSTLAGTQDLFQEEAVVAYLTNFTTIFSRRKIKEAREIESLSSATAPKSHFAKRASVFFLSFSLLLGLYLFRTQISNLFQHLKRPSISQANNVESTEPRDFRTALQRFKQSNRNEQAFKEFERFALDNPDLIVTYDPREPSTECCQAPWDVTPDKYRQEYEQQRNTDLNLLFQRSSHPAARILLQIEKSSPFTPDDLEESYRVKDDMAALLDDFVTKGLTIDEATKIAKAEEDDTFLKRLLEIKGRSSYLAKGAVSRHLRHEAMHYIYTLNDRHERPDAVRFSLVEGLPARELYYLMVEGEAEIYTSTFNGLFNRLLVKLQKENVSSADFLKGINYDEFRTFLKMTASYNRLNEFLATMNAPTQIFLLQQFVTNLEVYSDLSQPTIVADTLPSLKDPAVLQVVLRTLKNEYERSEREHNPKGVTIYGLLSSMASSLNPSDPWFQLMKEKYSYSLPSGISSTDLFDGNGINIQQYFFYNDDDGRNSFSSLLAAYRNDPKWHVENKGAYVLIRSLGKGRRIELYANRPENEEEGPKAITGILTASHKIPQFIVHRGHSFHALKTIDQIPSNTKLVYLGSCGGYTNVSAVMDKAQDAQIISTKGTGRHVINDAVLKMINTEMLRSGSIHWESFWRVAAQRFDGDSDFLNYVPPNKNQGVAFIWNYHRAIEKTQHEISENSLNIPLPAAALKKDQSTLYSPTVLSLAAGLVGAGMWWPILGAAGLLLLIGCWGWTVFGQAHDEKLRSYRAVESRRTFLKTAGTAAAGAAAIFFVPSAVAQTAELVVGKAIGSSRQKIQDWIQALFNSTTRQDAQIKLKTAVIIDSFLERDLLEFLVNKQLASTSESEEFRSAIREILESRAGTTSGTQALWKVAENTPDGMTQAKSLSLLADFGSITTIQNLLMNNYQELIKVLNRANPTTANYLLTAMEHLSSRAAGYDGRLFVALCEALAQARSLGQQDLFARLTDVLNHLEDPLNLFIDSLRYQVTEHTSLPDFSEDSSTKEAIHYLAHSPELSPLEGHWTITARIIQALDYPDLEEDALQILERLDLSDTGNADRQKEWMLRLISAKMTADALQRPQAEKIHGILNRMINQEDGLLTLLTICNEASDHTGGQNAVLTEATKLLTEVDKDSFNAVSENDRNINLNLIHLLLYYKTRENAESILTGHSIKDPGLIKLLAETRDDLRKNPTVHTDEEEALKKYLSGSALNPDISVESNVLTNLRFALTDTRGLAWLLDQLNDEAYRDYRTPLIKLIAQGLDFTAVEKDPVSLRLIIESLENSETQLPALYILRKITQWDPAMMQFAMLRLLSMGPMNAPKVSTWINSQQVGEHLFSKSSDAVRALSQRMLKTSEMGFETPWASFDPENLQIELLSNLFKTHLQAAFEILSIDSQATPEVKTNILLLIAEGMTDPNFNNDKAHPMWLRLVPSLLESLDNPYQRSSAIVILGRLAQDNPIFWQAVSEESIGHKDPQIVPPGALGKMPMTEKIGALSGDHKQIDFNDLLAILEKTSSSAVLAKTLRLAAQVPLSYWSSANVSESTLHILLMTLQDPSLAGPAAGILKLIKPKYLRLQTLAFLLQSLQSQAFETDTMLLQKLLNDLVAQPESRPVLQDIATHNLSPILREKASVLLNYRQPVAPEPLRLKGAA